MPALKYLLKKEFLQIIRNKGILPLIFIMPIIQLLILPLAADYEIKNINITIVDHDRSELSQRLINKISASRYFRIHEIKNTYAEAFGLLEKDETDVILEIPPDLEKQLVRNHAVKLYVGLHAINGIKAGLGGSYLQRIIYSFNSQISAEWLGVDIPSSPTSLSVVPGYLYNPLMNYRSFMVPGILAVLVTMVGSLLSALNIVREKELGTIEQINVTPIRKFEFILGKLIPFWIIGILVFSVGFWIVSMGIYGIIPKGSIILLYISLGIYLVSITGLGLLISTYCETQQQAMSIGFLVMMVFMLMSGFFTPIDGMPQWAKVISYLSPLTYFIEIMRMVILKGSSWVDIQKHLLIIFAFGIVFNLWSIWNYRKTE